MHIPDRLLSFGHETFIAPGSFRATREPGVTPMNPKPDDLVLPFASSAEFERWLAKHHRKAAVVWIKYAKKAAGNRRSR
jgi:hypothetical protein